VSTGQTRLREVGEVGAFETRDFYLACFLRCTGYDLIDLRVEGGRKVFIFRDRPRRRDDVLAFYGTCPDGSRADPVIFLRGDAVELRETGLAANDFYLATSPYDVQALADRLLDKRDPARPPLRRIHPVAAPRISANIPVSAIPDVEPIKRVEQNRQPDPEQFQEKHQRQVREKAHLARIRIRPGDGRRVRNQNMFKQECAHRNDPRKGMQPAQ